MANRLASVFGIEIVTLPNTACWDWKCLRWRNINSPTQTIDLYSLDDRDKMISEIEKIGENEVKEILADIISNKLSEQEKLIISLVFYEELNIKEIAEILECSEVEALDLYKRAMKKIEELAAIHLNGERIA